MATPTHNISVFSNGTIDVWEPEPPTVIYDGWRCLHEAEGGYDSDSDGMPEIRPGWQADDVRAEAPPIKFIEPLQWLSWYLNGYNSTFTKNNWRKVYEEGIAFCNNNGFGNPADPRWDYVNNVDVGEPLPKLMKGIICGGMFIRGIVVVIDGRQYLKCLPGIHAIDPTKAIPTVEKAFAMNWYFEATTQYNGKMSHFPQGHGNPVWIPYVLLEPTVYPLEWFERWVSEELPNPLTIYSPR